MTAIARLTSENKVDKMYALKYYTYYLISLLTFLSSIYFIYKGLYFNTFVFFCYSILFFRFKNIYADYSKESKCKHPNTVNDFLNLINTRKKTYLGQIIKNDFDGFNATLFFIIYTLFIGIPILISINFISQRTGVNPWLYASNFLLGYVLLFCSYMTHETLNSNDVDYQKIDFSLIEKIQTIKFNSVERKESFFNDIKNHFKLNKEMNRHQLFYIIEHMKSDLNGANIIDFLDKSLEK